MFGLRECIEGVDFVGGATLSRVVIRLVGFACGFLLIDLGWWLE